MTGKFVIDGDILYYQTNFGPRIKMTGSPYANLSIQEMSKRFDEPKVKERPFHEPKLTKERGLT